MFSTTHITCSVHPRPLLIGVLRGLHCTHSITKGNTSSRDGTNHHPQLQGTPCLRKKIKSSSLRNSLLYLLSIWTPTKKNLCYANKTDRLIMICRLYTNQPLNWMVYSLTNKFIQQLKFNTSCAVNPTETYKASTYSTDRGMIIHIFKKKKRKKVLPLAW